MLLVLKRCRLHTRLNIYREPESRLRPELWSSRTSQEGWVRQEGESCVLASVLVYFHCQTELHGSRDCVSSLFLMPNMSA